MNKPFSLVYEDFKQELANIINNCGLPASVIELTLQNFLYEVRDVARNQYKTDKYQYEKSLEENYEKNNLTNNEINK